MNSKCLQTRLLRGSNEAVKTKTLALSIYGCTISNPFIKHQLILVPAFFLSIKPKLMLKTICFAFINVKTLQLRINKENVCCFLKGAVHLRRAFCSFLFHLFAQFPFLGFHLKVTAANPLLEKNTQTSVTCRKGTRSLITPTFQLGVSKGTAMKPSLSLASARVAVTG